MTSVITVEDDFITRKCCAPARTRRSWHLQTRWPRPDPRKPHRLARTALPVLHRRHSSDHLRPQPPRRIRRQPRSGPRPGCT